MNYSLDKTYVFGRTIDQLTVTEGEAKNFMDAINTKQIIINDEDSK